MSQSVQGTPAAQMNPTPSAPTASQIPDLLKIGAIPSNVVMDVETDVLEPVVQSETFCRFTLENKGILHSHSKVQFCLSSPVHSYLPVNIGIAALIQRATLKVGNKTICEIDDFNYYTAYRSMFMSNEVMRERLMFQTGQIMSHQLCYLNEHIQAGTGGLFGGGASNVNAGAKDYTQADDLVTIKGGGLALDTGAFWRDPIETYDSIDALSMPTTSSMKSDGGLPTWQFSIADFFPFLKINQLPLYMMKEQINLEFVFSNKGVQGTSYGDRAWIKSGQTADQAVTLVTTETRMIADYIFYPQEMMVQYANANKKLQFSYVDYRLSKYSVGYPASTGTQIRNLGGAGRLVSKVVWGLCPSTTLSGGEDAPLREYQAKSNTFDYTTGGDAADASRVNGVLTSNLKFNDVFVYPIDVENSSRHYHNVVQAEGLVPFISREEYANEGQSLTARTLEDQVLNTKLQGSFFWQGCKVNRAERINSRGIELYFKFSLPSADTYTQRAWLEIIRYATIEDGYTECYFA
jgi:hypothetical protein